MPGDGYKYKYNGKEYEDALGLNMYEYGARNYDPAVGRWMNVDNLSELYYDFSPYVYAANNPVYYVDPDGNYIRIYYSLNGKDQYYDYTYVENRDYSEFKGFLLDQIMMLDRIYEAATIDVEMSSEGGGTGGGGTNILQKLIDHKKELGIVAGVNGAQTFAPNVKYDPRNPLENMGGAGTIGLIRFDTRYGVLFDDVKDSDSRILQQAYDKGVMPAHYKINSPASVMGHELTHAFNYMINGKEYLNRRDNKKYEQNGFIFKNQEEAKATSMSTQINFNLGENARLNHKGINVPVINVLSNQLK